MPALQVKDCPIEVYERLRECAARENRSIAQQTVTILEEYLGLRPASKPTAPNMTPKQPERPHARYSNAYDDGIDYAAKHRAVFAEIEKFPPIPISDRTPRTDILLAQIREEEAR